MFLWMRPAILKGSYGLLGECQYRSETYPWHLQNLPFTNEWDSSTRTTLSVKLVSNAQLKVCFLIDFRKCQMYCSTSNLASSKSECVVSIRNQAFFGGDSEWKPWTHSVRKSETPQLEWYLVLIQPFFKSLGTSERLNLVVTSWKWVMLIVSHDSCRWAWSMMVNVQYFSTIFCWSSLVWVAVTNHVNRYHD